jgi:hypothetical protein
MSDSAALLPASPFLNMDLELSPRVFKYDDAFAADFLAAIEEPETIPAFLSDPRPEYLRATELMDILQVLGASHMSEPREVKS